MVFEVQNFFKLFVNFLPFKNKNMIIEKVIFTFNKNHILS